MFDITLLSGYQDYHRVFLHHRVFLCFYITLLFYTLKLFYVGKKKAFIETGMVTFYLLFAQRWLLHA